MLLGLIYPIYNLVKRSKTSCSEKHPEAFWESSYFLNNMDIAVPFTTSALIGIALMYFQNKARNGVNDNAVQPQQQQEEQQQVEQRRRPVTGGVVFDGASGEALDRASWGSQEEYHLQVSRCPARPEPASLMNHLQSPRCNTRTRLSSEWSEESEAVFRKAV